MPEAAIVAPWIRKEMVCAELSPEVMARHEREQTSAPAEAMRREERRKEKPSFYCSDRARSR
jgi:hypothetical protein